MNEFVNISKRKINEQTAIIGVLEDKLAKSRNGKRTIYRVYGVSVTIW